MWENTQLPTNKWMQTNKCKLKQGTIFNFETDNNLEMII